MPDPRRIGEDLSSSWSRPLFEEITDLLAEALYQDFQQHRNATVNSPLGINHRIMLTSAPDKTK